MPTTLLNGVQIYWANGEAAGEPVVLVHGSWGDHANWAPVDPLAGPLPPTAIRA